MSIENAPLLLLFFLIATIYSSVGFGGGSSYIAVLILFGMSYDLAPKVALICNLSVVSGTTIYFIYRRQLSFRHIFPFLVTSIPFSFFGGMLRIKESFFYGLLGLFLFFAALKMIFSQKIDSSYSDNLQNPSWFSAIFCGGSIGFFSGLLAIGGGIFLAPILYLFRWGKPSTIAASSAFFILVNSFFGLLGQWKKSQWSEEILAYWPFAVVVFFGSQTGVFLLHKRFSQRKIEVFTAILLIFIAVAFLRKAVKV